MNLIAATAKFTPAGDVSRLLDLFVQVKVYSAVGKAQQAVLEEAKALCPVDTGDLRASITYAEPVDNGKQIRGEVSANMPYAAYVEFGTGHRGASSPGAGPFPYTMTWPGMAAQPYMRPALDNSRDKVLSEFKEA